MLHVLCEAVECHHRKLERQGIRIFFGNFAPYSGNWQSPLVNRFLRLLSSTSQQACERLSRCLVYDEIGTNISHSPHKLLKTRILVQIFFTVHTIVLRYTVPDMRVSSSYIYGTLSFHSLIYLHQCNDLHVL